MSEGGHGGSGEMREVCGLMMSMDFTWTFQGVHKVHQRNPEQGTKDKTWTEASAMRSV